MSVVGFISEGIFFDDKAFPYGFKKSGDFTIGESDMLTEYGLRLLALENGAAPVSEQEREFIEMVKGEREPSTKLERAWVKYRKLTKGRRIYTLSSNPDSSASIADLSDGDDDL